MNLIIYLIKEMKIKHYSIFNDHKNSKIDWDFLRKSKKDPEYYMPQTEEEYKLIINEKNYKNIIKATSNYINTNKLNTIISLGSGRAALEYQLKLKTGIKTIISDITNSIFTLKKLNFFDEVLLVDITKKLDINISEKSIVILPRIDTELSDSQIYQLFKTLNKKGVKHILFIPAQLISIKSILIQLYILFKALIQKKSLVDCGYSRSRAKFKKLWKEYYDIHKSYNFKYLFLINKSL